MNKLSKQPFKNKCFYLNRSVQAGYLKNSYFFHTFHSFFPIKAWSKSMGKGKTTVVAFSLEISFKVCK